MDLNNPPKFYLLLITLIGVFALMLTDHIDTDNAQAWALIGSIVGYGIGNGIAAKAGQVVEPVFTTRRRPPVDDQGTLDVVLGWLVMLAAAAIALVCAWLLITYR
jgi:hypothetical protein